MNTKLIKNIFQRSFSVATLVLITTVVYVVLTKDTNHWNGLEEADDDTLLKKITNRFYYSSMVYSTVGFGDITPKTRLARSLTNVQLIIVILNLIALFTVYKERIELE
jgi:hypothetical protein